LLVNNSGSAAAAAAVPASLVLLLVNPVSAAAALPAISVFNACEMDTKQNQQALLQNQVLLWKFMSLETKHGTWFLPSPNFPCNRCEELCKILL
jgi:hypothetical protein